MTTLIGRRGLLLMLAIPVAVACQANRQATTAGPQTVTLAVEGMT